MFSHVSSPLTGMTAFCCSLPNGCVVDVCWTSGGSDGVEDGGQKKVIRMPPSASRATHGKMRCPQSDWCVDRFGFMYYADQGIKQLATPEIGRAHSTLNLRYVPRRRKTSTPAAYRRFDFRLPRVTSSLVATFDASCTPGICRAVKSTAVNNNKAPMGSNKIPRPGSPA